MFGGEGSMQMAAIARALADVQLIVLCGRNQKLARKLATLSPSAPHAVVAFTPQVPNYMRLGDFFVGKPGPGSLSEAVHSGLPIVTFENTWTMPQERYNAQWVRELDIGVVLPSLRLVRSGAADVIQRLDALRANVQRIHNRAVFEVPQILDRLMRTGVDAAPSLPAPHAQVRSSTPAIAQGAPA
jgi:UDP-N-acetylglucosamine:LPS N-acetylglucosamine transferase